MTRNERQELQAQTEHPTLYKLGQHGPMQLLGRLVWGGKALKTAKKLATPAPRYYTPHTRSQVVHVHVYAGANVQF